MTGERAGRKPNIVLFVADDLGWGDLGCYGATAIPTPTIDRLAAAGLRFTDAHASSAVCTPSRYSLLTGCYPWRSPLQTGVLGGTDPAIIAPNQATVAHALRAAGYSTGAFGKWHLGLDWTTTDGTVRNAFTDDDFSPAMEAHGRDVDYRQPFRSGPIEHGFDRFFGIAGSLDMPPYCFLSQDRTVGIPDREKTPLITSQRPGLQVSGWHDDQVDVRITEESSRWIREAAARDEPFFAYVAAAAPHRPCVPPAFVAGRSAAGDRGDAVTLVDWMVSELLRTLEESNVADDTIIVLTSDNGAPMIFPEDGDVVDHRPNGPWRGQKADAWEGGHRIPLVVSGPDVAVGVVDHTASLLDLLPTIASLAGAPCGEHDGLPIAELAERTSGQRVLGQQAFDGTLVLREGDFKTIFSDGSGGFSEPVGEPQTPGGKRGQFYDLARDPAETNDLWAQRSHVARRMFDRFADETGYPDLKVAESCRINDPYVEED